MLEPTGVRTATLLLLLTALHSGSTENASVINRRLIIPVADDEPVHLRDDDDAGIRIKPLENSLNAMFKPLVDSIVKLSHSIPAINYTNGNVMFDSSLKSTPGSLSQNSSLLDGTWSTSGRNSSEVIAINVQTSKKPCTTADGKTGKCVTIGQCHSPITSHISSLLRSFCLQNRRQLGVCCPLPVSSELVSNNTIVNGTQNDELVSTSTSTTAEQTSASPSEPVTSPETSTVAASTVSSVELTSTTPVLKPKDEQQTTQKDVSAKSTTTRTTSGSGRQCGQVMTPLLRIVGGELSEPGAWPWVAAIYLDTSKGREFWCGGSLINERYVLTAAHCTLDSKQKRLRSSRFTVKFGEFLLSQTDPGESQVYHVINVNKHPHFSYRGFYNDMALLLLDRPVEFTDFVQPICLPTAAQSKKLFVGEMATVIGWGSTYYGGNESPALRLVHLPIWRNEDCDQSYFQPITDVFLCAGYAEGGKDTCQGDSGGPMMLYLDNRWVQIGIVSFGNKCAEPGFPGVFTRLTKFVDWIEANTLTINFDAHEITTALPPSTSLKPIRFPDDPSTVSASTSELTTRRPAVAKPSDQSRCGQVPSASLRIVGGNVAQIGAWPWMAAIFLHNHLGEQFWCGGSLINDRYVLTAAHCTQDGKQRRFHPAQYTIKLGEFNLNEPDVGESGPYRVVTIKIHQRFIYRGFYNDLALFKLDRPVPFSDYVQPICLPTGSMREEKYVGETGVIAGWGTTSYGGKESPVLLEVALPIWRNEDCDRSYAQSITEIFMCAGFREGGKDGCQGDSGGPLMLGRNETWTQIGIVSFGNKCAQPGLPGVYTRITHFLDWILDNAT